MNDTVLLNFYLIDGIKYYVLNEIDLNGNHYVYLSNEKDEKDILIRKVNGDILEPMETEEELLSVIQQIVK